MKGETGIDVVRWFEEQWAPFRALLDSDPVVAARVRERLATRIDEVIASDVARLNEHLRKTQRALMGASGVVVSVTMHAEDAREEVERLRERVAALETP